jgi:hypothetical protein
MMAATITSQMNAIIALVLSSSPSIAPKPIPRPDTLKGIDDLIRAGFEAYRGSCFNWLLAATGLVVVGLVLEGPELWHDITSIVRRWHFKRRFHFSLPEEHSPDWVKLLAFVGWLLIVIGVAGEYVADSFVSKADGYVQTFDEILLTETQRGTALARERASAAYERASENEKETADTLKQAQQERADAAKSLAAAETATKEAKGYGLQIAQANERAAAANEIAERERLARLQLEARLADRVITPDQQRRIMEAFASMKGQTVDVAIVGDSVELTKTATAILGSIRNAGVLLNFFHPISGGYAEGVIIGIRANAPDEAKQAGGRLITILRETLDGGVGQDDFDKIVITGTGTLGSDKGATLTGQAPIRLLIAPK